MTITKPQKIRLICMTACHCPTCPLSACCADASTDAINQLFAVTLQELKNAGKFVIIYENSDGIQNIAVGGMETITEIIKIRLRLHQHFEIL